MNKLTSDWVYNTCQSMYDDHNRNSRDYYDPEIFIGDIENVISDACDNDFITDTEKLEVDFESSILMLTGVVAWLRSADGVNAFTDQNALEIILELNYWAENNLPNN